MAIDWLASELVCEGITIRPSLNPNSLADEDLPDICLRMHVILDTIEFARCEGRLINPEIFDSIDTLYSALLHKYTNNLSDWLPSIVRVGDYYSLDGRGSILLSPRSLTAFSSMFERLGIQREST